MVSMWIWFFVLKRETLWKSHHASQSPTTTLKTQHCFVNLRKLQDPSPRSIDKRSETNLSRKWSISRWCTTTATAAPASRCPGERRATPPNSCGSSSETAPAAAASRVAPPNCERFTMHAKKPSADPMGPGLLNPGKNIFQLMSFKGDSNRSVSDAAWAKARLLIIYVIIFCTFVEFYFYSLEANSLNVSWFVKRKQKERTDVLVEWPNAVIRIPDLCSGRQVIT